MASTQSKKKTTTAGTKRAAASSSPKTTSTRAKTASTAAPKARTTTRKRATVPDAAIVTMAAVGGIYQPTHDEIAARAHLLFERDGHQHGRDEEHWLEAERQLIAERSR